MRSWTIGENLWLVFNNCFNTIFLNAFSENYCTFDKDLLESHIIFMWNQTKERLNALVGYNDNIVINQLLSFFLFLTQTSNFITSA